MDTASTSTCARRARCCSNCGGAIDLGRDSVCAHCGTPISVLDLKHISEIAESLVTRWFSGSN